MHNYYLFVFRGVDEVGEGVVKEEETSMVLEEVKEALVQEESKEAMVLEEAVGWRVACSTVEEWTNLVEQLRPSKHQDTKRLVNALQGIVCTHEHTHACPSHSCGLPG